MLGSTFDTIDNMTAENVNKLMREYSTLNNRKLTSEEEQLFQQLKEHVISYRKAVTNKSPDYKYYKGEINRLYSKIDKLLSPKNAAPSEPSKKTMAIEIPVTNHCGNHAHSRNIQAVILDVLKKTFNQNITVLEGKELSDYLNQLKDVVPQPKPSSNKKAKSAKIKSNDKENLFTNYAEQVQDDRQRELFMQNTFNFNNQELYYTKEEMDLILTQSQYMESTPLYIASLSESSSDKSETGVEAASINKRSHNNMDC